MKELKARAKEDTRPARNQGKPPICRISSLNEFGGVLYGRDMGGIFKEGHVYSAIEVMGEIILTDLGKHATPKWLGTRGTINQYATSGTILFTEAEYEKLEDTEGEYYE